MGRTATARADAALGARAPLLRGSPAPLGAIPFLDVGNTWLFSGASFSPEVLQGKSADAIASQLTDPNSDVATGVNGTANVMTAAICDALGTEAPHDVCPSAVQDELPH